MCIQPLSKCELTDHGHEQRLFSVNTYQYGEAYLFGSCLCLISQLIHIILFPARSPLLQFRVPGTFISPSMGRRRVPKYQMM